MSTLKQNLQKQFACSISRQTFINPVLTVDGHTYQKSSIQQWFKKTFKSPNTNSILPSKELIPNLKIKFIIQNLLPKIYDTINQNDDLKQQIKRLKMRIDGMTNEQQSQEQKRQKKQKKLLNKMPSQKSLYVTQLEQRIQSLNDQVRKLKRQSYDTNLKHATDYQQFQTANNELKERINQHNKQTQFKLTKLKDFYIDCLQTQTTILQNVSKVIYLTLNKVNKSKQGNKIMIQLSDLFKQLSKQYKDYGNYQFMADTYEIHRFMVNNVRINDEDIFKKCFYPSIWGSPQRNFCRTYQAVPFNVFKQIDKIWPSKIQSSPILKKIIECIYTYPSAKFKEEGWLSIVRSNCRQFIKCLCIKKCQLAHIERGQIQQFPNLQYLDLSETDLTVDSIESLNQYIADNPTKIVIYKPKNAQNN